MQTPFDDLLDLASADLRQRDLARYPVVQFGVRVREKTGRLIGVLKGEHRQGIETGEPLCRFTDLMIEAVCPLVRRPRHDLVA